MLLFQKLQQVWQIENKRYEKKGKTNILTALALLVSIIWLSLEFGRAVWPEHVEDRGMFVFYWEIIIHTVALVLSFLLYLPGYLNWTTAYQKYQINKGSKWPWQRDNWNSVCKKMLLNVFFNDFVIYPIVVYLATSRGIKQRFNEFPTFWELFGQLVVVYYLEDFFFYWGHRTFHETPVLYKFHKVHHEFDKIFTVVTEYIHPVDLILGNVVPSALAMLILGPSAHCFTYFFWVGYKVMLGYEHHAGYEIPWSPMRILPLVGGASFHDHHHSSNVGNYAGSCYLWDVLLGTSDHYFKTFLKQE